MPIMNKLSGAFPATLAYITIGVLIEVWSIVWLLNFSPETPVQRFWFMGFAFTGIALFFIGVFLGRIGRAARTAELPPQKVVAAVKETEKTLAEAGEKPNDPQEKPAIPQPAA